MGIREIIKEGSEDAPTHNVFVDDGSSDDEDIPIAENIYSDASSDTEFDGEELIELFESSDSLDDVIEELDDIMNYESLIDNTVDNTHRLVEESRPIVVESSTFPDRPSQTPVKKFKNTTSRSRQGLGKKKARRVENARLLDQMRGDDDSDGCDINDFMPVDCSFRFTQILEDADLTNKVLNPCVDNYDVNYDFFNSSTSVSVKKSKENTSRRRKLSAQAAFDNLYASEKDLFRRRNLPMGMVQYLDTCVLSFFEENPTGTYVSEPLSSFERMMLHSIAHFYELRSSSFNADNFNCRLTKVTNAFDYFDPPHLCLSKYVEQLTSKDINSKSRKCKRFRRR